MPSPQPGNSFKWLLMNRNPSESSWKPKRANILGAPPFPMNNWRRRYRVARSSSKNKAVVNGISRNFERAYRAWLTNIAARDAARRKKLENEFNRLREEIRRERRVARTPATPQRPNHVAAAKHAGSVRSVSPRRRVLTAGIPRNAIERARANARLTAELQNVVKALETSLRAAQ